MDEEWKFGGIAEKEDGSVVVDPVPIPFFGIEFDGEASWISCGICTPFLSANSGKSGNTWSLLPNFFEHVYTGLYKSASHRCAHPGYNNVLMNEISSDDQQEF